MPRRAGGEADRRGQFLSEGKRGEETGVTQLWPPAEKREEVEAGGRGWLVDK